MSSSLRRKKQIFSFLSSATSNKKIIREKRRAAT
jgi:hypothetical protein